MTRNRDEHGAVAVLVAVMAIFIFGLAAVVVDLGYGRVERRAAQNGADAAALAGGNVLFAANPLSPDYPTATAAVKDYASKNLGVTDAEWTGCVDAAPLATSSGTPCISYYVTPTIAQVRVKIPTRDVGTTFAKVIGVNSINVSALARATLKRGGASECGLCVLGSNQLHDIQNGDVTVTGADIHFNGNVSVSANGLVATTGQITVEGTATGPLTGYAPDPTAGVPPITDPLADYLDEPVMTGLPIKTDPCSALSGGPGKYGDVNLRNSACFLSPGVYVITGTWDMAGNASTLLSGTGVTLFFTCGTPSAIHACAVGEVGGTIDNSGNGTLAIQAPLTGDYQGMAIWYDRNNSATLRMTGNGNAGYTGTVYGNSIKMLMNGNGCTATINALIIIKTLEFNGNPACMTSAYAQGANVQIPPGALHLDQ